MSIYADDALDIEDMSAEIDELSDAELAHYERVWDGQELLESLRDHHLAQAAEIDSLLATGVPLGWPVDWSHYSDLALLRMQLGDEQFRTILDACYRHNNMPTAPLDIDWEPW